MKADFNPYSAEQREHEEMMIKQLEDDDKGEDDDDDEADGKKQMLLPKVSNKGKSKITNVVKQSTTSCGKQKKMQH